MFGVIFRGFRVIEPNILRQGTQLGKRSIVHYSKNYTPQPLIKKKSKAKDSTVSQSPQKNVANFSLNSWFFFCSRIISSI